MSEPKTAEQLASIQITARKAALAIAEHCGFSSASQRHCDFIEDAIIRATEPLEKEIERLKDGEKWAASMFCKIMVAAICGVADAAIVANQKMGPEHALAAVKQCSEHAKRLEKRVKELEAALALSVSVMDRAHPRDCSGYTEGCKCSRCVALRVSTAALSPNQKDV